MISLPSTLKINLRLNYLFGITVGAVQPCHIDLVIKVSNVTNDGLISHHAEVLFTDNVFVSCCSYYNLCTWNGISMRFTSKPSIAACNAQIGSISVTITRAPAPRNDAAVPLLHHRNRQQQRLYLQSSHQLHDGSHLLQILDSRICYRTSTSSQNRLR